MTLAELSLDWEPLPFQIETHNAAAPATPTAYTPMAEHRIVTPDSKNPTFDLCGVDEEDVTTGHNLPLLSRFQPAAASAANCEDDDAESMRSIQSYGELVAFNYGDLIALLNEPIGIIHTESLGNKIGK